MSVLVVFKPPKKAGVHLRLGSPIAVDVDVDDGDGRGGRRFGRPRRVGLGDGRRDAGSAGPQAQAGALAASLRFGRFCCCQMGFLVKTSVHTHYLTTHRLPQIRTQLFPIGRLQLTRSCKPAVVLVFSFVLFCVAFVGVNLSMCSLQRGCLVRFPSGWCSRAPNGCNSFASEGSHPPVVQTQHASTFWSFSASADV